ICWGLDCRSTSRTWRSTLRRTRRQSRLDRSWSSIAERQSGKTNQSLRVVRSICFFLLADRIKLARIAIMSSLPRPQHLFADMLARVCAAAGIVSGSGADLSRIVVELPRDPTHGDMATNAAMVLAKDAGTKARELAESIAEKLRVDEKIAKVTVAGPGFINLALKPHVWGEELRLVLDQGGNYGRSTIGQGEKVNVEYVSANPTGPLHVGHGRGAVFGDALANLLAFVGYSVTREY